MLRESKPAIAIKHIGVTTIPLNVVETDNAPFLCFNTKPIHCTNFGTGV